MKDIQQFNHKKVFILGLGKSGFNAGLLLSDLGAEVVVNEMNDLSGTEDLKTLEAANIKGVYGHHDVDMLDNSFEFLLKSPGIPYENEMIQKAISINLPIITDIELAYRLGEADIVAITGTNGKTTTTTLVTDLLNNQPGRKGQAYSAGNIGISVSEVVQEASLDDEIVMELSSFQLMGVDQFKPHISVILNIYSAHLDYHHTRKDYIEAKSQIVKNQSADDYFIYNADQEEVVAIAEQTSAKGVPFSRQRYLENGVSLKGDAIYAFGELMMNRHDVSLKGDHNLENVLAAIAVAKLKGISDEVIVDLLTHFNGIKHRLQFVDTINERNFYNDSKATNSQSTKFAIEGFKHPIILLVGGLDREEDLSELIEPMKKHVKAVIISGENKEAFREIAKKSGINRVHEALSMYDAVQFAYNESDNHDVILLSPASASWDKYDNFEQRGDDFINEVNEIKKEVL